MNVLFSLLFSAIMALPGSPDGKNDTPLREYVYGQDNSYKWEVVDSVRTEKSEVFRLILTSQSWRGFLWKHELDITIPDEIKYPDALIYITGGVADKDSAMPRKRGFRNAEVMMTKSIAEECGTVAATLFNVPRQPLYNDLYEDALLSYTLHEYLDDNDKTWPLLFPMAKSVVKAMDAITEFVKSRRGEYVGEYTLCGASKRGWTTFITAATRDKRIKAIAPMVIDILNMPVNVPYQKHMYGAYSIEIKDYVNLGLTEGLSGKDKTSLLGMIDPYSYRKDYKIPKLLLLATNDQYWTVDAVKNYFYDLPQKKWICYTPNVNHSLGDWSIAESSLEAFYYQTITGSEYADFNYSFEGTVPADDCPKRAIFHLEINGNSYPEEVTVYQAESSDKDFRDETFFPFSFKPDGGKKQAASISLPEQGFKAFYIELKYPHPVKKGKTYSLTTRMYTASPEEVFDSPFTPEPEKP